MTNVEFEEIYYPRYKNVIAGIARKYAKRDEELFQDLKQEGAFALLKLKPERAKTNLDAWIRQAVRYRMIDYLRRTRIKDHRSLQQYLENGCQVTLDDELGECRILLWRRVLAPGERLHESVDGVMHQFESFDPDDATFREFLGEG